MGIYGEGCYLERTTDPKGNITIKEYDKTGRLIKVIAGPDTVTYTYFANGSRESVIYNDGTREEYTYNANSQIETLINRRADGSILDSYAYTYDSAGNQLTKNEIIGGLEKGTTTYTYDSLNRLLTVTEPTGRGMSYEYDKAGNRTKETITVTDTAGSSIATVNTYTYDTRNRLTEITTKVNNVLTKTTSYTYDNNGNQLTTVVKSYFNGTTVTSTIATLTNTYDLHNQLTQSVTENGTTVNNIYNAEGYRVGKEVITGEGEREYTRYLYEADKVILETGEAGDLNARNIYGTNLLIRITGSTAYQYLYNGHADVTALVTRDGIIAATYYYDAFGNILESTGNIDNSILYAGYQYDIETGLYYLNARMYDPVTARFLQEDTYKGDPKDPLSLNLHTYCINNPMVYYDPTGHMNLFVDAASGVVKSENKALKTLKAVGKRAEALGKGALNIVQGIYEPTVLWSELGAGWAMNKFGAIDNQTYGYYKENVWNDINQYADNPNFFKPLANYMALGIGEVYLHASNQSQQVIDYYEVITWNDIVKSGPEAVDSLVKPFRTTFNKKNAYNFFCNTDTTDTQLEEYATNALGAGMMLYGLGKSSGIKPQLSSINLNRINYGSSTLEIASTSVSVPTLAFEGASLGYLAYSTAGSIGASQYNGSNEGDPNASVNTGRGKNNIKPDENAQGAHSVYKREPNTGKVTNYKTYEPNPKNPSGFDEVLGYDSIGKPHVNKATGEPLMPHVHDKAVPGGVRTPYPYEIP